MSVLSHRGVNSKLYKFISERARVMRLVPLTMCHKHTLVEENDSNSKRTDGEIMFNIVNLQQTIKNDYRR